MEVLVADNDKRVFQVFKDYEPDFQLEFGNPMAYDVDAVVSPANTLGIMNGGFDASIRRVLGTWAEVNARKAIDERGGIKIGEAIVVSTYHKKITKLIVAPTISHRGEMGGETSFIYDVAFSAVTVAKEAGIKKLGMTSLGTGARGLNIYETAVHQIEGIHDALYGKE